MRGNPASVRRLGFIFEALLERSPVICDGRLNENSATGSEVAPEINSAYVVEKPRPAGEQSFRRCIAVKI